MHFFETSAMLITFLTLGRTLESRAKGKTGAAIEALLKLQPDTATLLALEPGTGAVLSETEVCKALPLCCGSTETLPKTVPFRAVCPATAVC
eukprot:SAG22_NODE_465_length_10181_cov_6.604444_12_plen_92_part_00